LKYNLDEGIPISIDWLMQNTNQFIVTYDTLKTCIYDTETGKILREITNDTSSNGDPSYRINRLISHPSQPIIITAHDDRKIRYFDSNSGMTSFSQNLLHKYSFKVE
jgi:striatin 1/3/4